ncbi:hypothetical protein ACFSVM_02080 [Paenibacillus shunpengii]|uniref:Uncharacterized protein n=1 Tax=Paenibacillus shunpengii TaxID=2054424 RepID=A0ABW5SKF9_9BACL
MQRRTQLRSNLEPAHKFLLRSFTLTNECPAATHAGLLTSRPFQSKMRKGWLSSLAPLRSERKVIGRSGALVSGREWLPSYLIICHSRTRTIGRNFRERSTLEPRQVLYFTASPSPKSVRLLHTPGLSPLPIEDEEGMALLRWLPCGVSEKLSGEAERSYLGGNGFLLI